MTNPGNKPNPSDLLTIILLAISISLIHSAVALCQEAEGEKLIIGTKPTAPFAMKAEDGSWYGISIELWRTIASDLELEYEFEERDLEALLNGLEDGSLDLVVSALTINSEREQKFDFSHPFCSGGLTIASSAAPGASFINVAEGLLSSQFLRVVGILIVILLATGFLVWAFERKRNAEQFGGGIGKGIGSGFWWSAVTMTTVGYGDKAPKTVGGRVVALIWMFAAIIIISSLTAAIASALTVSQLEAKISGPEDLPRVEVGTIASSTSEKYLQNNNINFNIFESPKEGLEAVAEGEIDAFVYDAPILKYLINTNFRGKLKTLPSTFLRQDYGIALTDGNPLREDINIILLREITQPEWDALLDKYMGK
jgi:ABC-type amino acid transport substrate-binding protein